MAWQRFLWSGQLTLLAYLVVNVLVIIINPAKFVTETTDFVGEPVGDLSEDVRLYLANKTGLSSDVNGTWELDDAACGFYFYWNTLEGISGNSIHQDRGLCLRRSSVDYYSIEGVDTMSPTGSDEEDCDAFVDQDGFDSYRFCDLALTRHRFFFSADLDNLGLSDGASATDIELLFSTGSHLGVYEFTIPIFECDEPEPAESSVDCELRFDFWNYPTFEIRNSTVGVRSAILGELRDLAREEWLPDDISKVGMEEGICDAIASTEELLDCSIVCEASYPYPSSVCVGTYESLLVEEVPHRIIVVSVMTAVSITGWLLLSTLRLGMRTANGRSQRGYLGPGGSSNHFFEEEGKRGDRISLANPLPPMQVAKVGTKGTNFFPYSGSGFPVRRREDGETTAALGIVVCPGVEEIPRELLVKKPGKTAALGHPERAGSFRSYLDSASNGGTDAVPIAFIARESPDGSLDNLDVEEVHRLLDKSGGRALLDESFGGDHLAWARGFSVVDAIGCVLTLWTVHFVAANSGWGSFYWVAALVALAKWLEETDVHNLVGLLRGGVQVMPKSRSWSAPPLPITLAVMEVLYDLSIPGVEVFGLIITAVWTAFVVLSCVYFISVLGYEPVYGGGGLYSSKVSLKTALAVGAALNCPFALAGDWVRGSRCGDIGGRLAVSFCVASPETPGNGERVSHVYFRSELLSTLETGVLCGDETGTTGVRGAVVRGEGGVATAGRRLDVYVPRSGWLALGCRGPETRKKQSR